MKHKSLDPETGLKERIGRAVDGLVYISETDAPIEVFYDSSMREPSPNELLRLIVNRKGSFTESHDGGFFFDRLTSIKEWHTADQRNTVRKFKKLRQLLENELEDLLTIRVGRIKIDIYVIGKASNGDVAGIKTVAVET